VKKYLEGAEGQEVELEVMWIFKISMDDQKRLNAEIEQAKVDGKAPQQAELLRDIVTQGKVQKIKFHFSDASEYSENKVDVAQKEAPPGLKASFDLIDGSSKVHHHNIHSFTTFTH
jgi:hypothetical protein